MNSTISSPAANDGAAPLQPSATEELLNHIAERDRTRMRSFVQNKLSTAVDLQGGHVTLLRAGDGGSSQLGRWESGAETVTPDAMALDIVLAWMLEQIIGLATTETASGPLKLRVRAWLPGGKAQGSCTFTVLSQAAVGGASSAAPSALPPAPRGPPPQKPHLEPRRPPDRRESDNRGSPPEPDMTAELETELSRERASRRRAERERDDVRSRLESMRSERAKDSREAHRAIEERNRCRDKLQFIDEERRRLLEERLEHAQQRREDRRDRDTIVEQLRDSQAECLRLRGHIHDLQHQYGDLERDRDEWKRLAENSVIDICQNAGYLSDEDAEGLRSYDEDDSDLDDEDSYSYDDFN